jgi:hypothetical protein
MVRTTPQALCGIVHCSLQEGMTIEFCGLPGVGKSTIARTLESHGFVRVRIQGKWELLWRNAVYSVCFPRAFFKMLRIIIRTSRAHGRFYPLFMNVFLDTNARIMKARTMDTNAIIDQGHVQALLSLSYHLLSDDEIQAYFRHLPLPDIVFAFEAPPSVRESHLTERGYRPRDGEYTDTREWLLNLERNAEQVTVCIEKHMPYRTIRVHTDRPIADTVTFIRGVCNA